MKQIKYPRIKKVELNEAIKLNLISQIDSKKMIKDPNQYSIFQEEIDFECTNTINAMNQLGFTKEDITLLKFNEFKSKNKSMLINQQHNKFGDEQSYENQLRLLVEYLQYVTQKYEPLKMFLQERSRAIQVKREVEKTIKNYTILRSQNIIGNNLEDEQTMKFSKINTTFEHNTSKDMKGTNVRSTSNLRYHDDQALRNSQSNMKSMNKSQNKQSLLEFNGLMVHRSSTIHNLAMLNLDQVMDKDELRQQNKIDFHKRHIDLQTKNKKEMENLLNSIKKNTDQVQKNKEKVLEKKQKMMRNMIDKVKDAQKRIDDLKQLEKQKMRDYLKKKKKREKELQEKLGQLQGQKNDVNLSVGDSKRANHLSYVQDFKQKQQEFEIYNGLNLLEKENMKFEKQTMNKISKTDDYLQKVKMHNQHIQDNYEKAQIGDQQEKERKEKRLYDELKQQQQYDMKEQSQKKKELKQQIKRKEEHHQKVNQNYEQNRKDDIRSRRQLAKEIDSRFKKQSTNLNEFLNNKTQKIKDSHDKRTNCLNQNQVELDKQKTCRNNRLDNKFTNISLNLSQHHEDKKQLINNRISMKGEIVMLSRAKDDLLDKINRDPSKY